MCSTSSGRAAKHSVSLLDFAAHMTKDALLQAEEDVRYVIAKRAADEKEAELMSGVPGWKVGASVFNSGAWMPPTLK